MVLGLQQNNSSFVNDNPRQALSRDTQKAVLSLFRGMGPIKNSSLPRILVLAPYALRLLFFALPILVRKVIKISLD